MPLALAIIIATGSLLLLLPEYQHNQQLIAFHQRCSDQGGIVLQSFSADSNEWIGCYKGVTEIPNE